MIMFTNVSGEKIRNKAIKEIFSRMMIHFESTFIEKPIKLKRKTRRYKRENNL